MKRQGYLIEKVADMDNLLMAFYLAQRGKQGKRDVERYRENLQSNLLQLRQQLVEGNVSVGNYHAFTIYDPKERKICAAEFGERVLHQALMRVCSPFFERQLIQDTYASRPGKGVYEALKKAHVSMRRYSFVAKLDVRKYFDSIDHCVLKGQLVRIFKDERLLRVLYDIIDAYCTTAGKGLPIGNLTSQYYANHYLSGLDHYAKEQLRIPAYMRYMDDILLFGKSRREVREWARALTEVAKRELLVDMKPAVVARCDSGVCFLGYRIQGQRIGLSCRSRNRFAHKLSVYNSLLERDKWNEGEFYAHVTPLLSFVKHAYTKKYRTMILNRSKPVGL